MSKYVLNAGTYDVHNYGDLLFTETLRPRIERAGARQLLVSPTCGQQHTCITGRAPIAVRQISMVQNCAALILGGGNIVDCAPTTLTQYRQLGVEATAYPDLWVTAARSMPTQMPIIWNSVGVARQFPKSWHGLVQETLGRTKHVSVRDTTSRDLLLEAAPSAEIHIVPDSAWALPLMHDFALSKVKNHLIRSTYAVVHLNRRSIDEDLLTFCEALKRELGGFVEEFVFVSMSQAHGDHVLCQIAADQMGEKARCLSNGASISEVVETFANAAVYVGAAMHGFILAESYGVPGLIISRNERHKMRDLETVIGYKILCDDWNDCRDHLLDACAPEQRSGVQSVVRKFQSRIVDWQRTVEKILRDADPLPIDHKLAARGRMTAHADILRSTDAAMDESVDIEQVVEKNVRAFNRSAPVDLFVCEKWKTRNLTLDLTLGDNEGLRQKRDELKAKVKAKSANLKEAHDALDHAKQSHAELQQLTNYLQHFHDHYNYWIIRRVRRLVYLQRAGYPMYRRIRTILGLEA